MLKYCWATTFSSSAYSIPYQYYPDIRYVVRKADSRLLIALYKNCTKHATIIVKKRSLIKRDNDVSLTPPVSVAVAISRRLYNDK